MSVFDNDISFEIDIYQRFIVINYNSLVGTADYFGDIEPSEKIEIFIDLTKQGIIERIMVLFDTELENGWRTSFHIFSTNLLSGSIHIEEDGECKVWRM